ATANAQAETLTGLSRLLEAGAASGDWRLDGDVTVHARLLLAAMYGLMTQWHLEPGSFSWDEAATALVSQLSSTRHAANQH
ncbi:MAG: TetR family transcriptional regulator C-terminal domain-containing protein, partial [Chloroflexota bacterium]|nr:TetR family transcriptional regulator C-terminal domain-containing protein [Chloroflexota bacterium]